MYPDFAGLLVCVIEKLFYKLSVSGKEVATYINQFCTSPYIQWVCGRWLYNVIIYQFMFVSAATSISVAFDQTFPGKDISTSNPTDSDCGSQYNKHYTINCRLA